MKPAPVALFVYNRPLHTRKTLLALNQNRLADETDLFVFSDGPLAESNERDLNNIEEVRKIIKGKNCFKSTTIIESSFNKGLADSVMDGVTHVLNKQGKVIVLEDDLETSSGFLEYMNHALSIYEQEEKVMHISGFMYPVKKRLPDTFFYNVNSCWGWGTWKRAWDKLEKDPHKLFSKLSESYDPLKFNGGQGDAFYRQLVYNVEGKLNTWAVRWHTSIYLNEGFCLHPAKSLVRNIGFDGSGRSKSNVEYLTNQNLTSSVKVVKQPVIENRKALKAIKLFFSRSENPVINIYFRFLRLINS